mgnify:CR=1 FL=1
MLTKIQKKDIRQANILFLIFYIKPILMLLLPLFLQKRKNGFYRTVLNNCLSFLNEVKNLAKNTGVKYVFAITRCRILR